MSHFGRAWKRYRYRFVPWLLFNLRNRRLRTVTQEKDQKAMSQSEFEESLFTFFSALNKLNGLNRPGRNSAEIMQETLGFTIQRSPSVIEGGGLGVKVASGTISAGQVTSLYPGLVYERTDPILFQSIGNPFIFKCADGILIDGNDKGLSKMMYNSCRGRDSCWPLPACDASWLTDKPFSSWNIGQYVNNQTKSHPANVTYAEFDIPDNFPARLRQYLPNIFYSSGYQYQSQMQTNRILRVVALISLTDIHCGEELFSSYFTLVR